jgi:hypothetical protein
MSFDITDIVLSTDSIYDRRLPSSKYPDLVKWLKENVGDIIPFEDTDRKWLEKGITSQGHGWRVECITETEKGDTEHDSMEIISWQLFIDDPELETLYALKWAI